MLFCSVVLVLQVAEIEVTNNQQWFVITHHQINVFIQLIKITLLRSVQYYDIKYVG